MKIEVLQENLVKTMGVIQKFIQTRSSIPTLTCVLIKVENKKVTLQASNLESAVEIGLAAKVEKEGVVSVPGKLLAEYIQSLPPGKVVLELDEQRLKIVMAGRRAMIAISPSEEYPDLPKVTTTQKTNIPLSVWESIAKKVTFATAHDDTRPVLSAVLLEFSKSKMKAVATDGYRLSILDKLSVTEGMDGKQFFVSARVLNDLVKLIRDYKVETVEMFWDEMSKSLFFVFDQVQMMTKVVEGDYPPYKKILPKEFEVEVKVSRKELLEAVKTAGVFARDGANIIKIEVQKGKLVATARSSQVGEQESEVIIEYTGEKTETIAFNNRYLIELLSNLEEEEVEFKMNGTLLPGVFTVEKQNYIHVIMPVRTQD